MNDYGHVPVGSQKAASFSDQNVLQEPAGRGHIQDDGRTPLAKWIPGFWRRLPWTGLLALSGTVVAAVAMIAILVSSNGRPVADWKVQPAVLLAIASAGANILVHYALSEGITVAWWVRVLAPGAKVADLHNIWSFGTSLKGALLSGTSFNLIALAGIVVAITPINGPLLQRASVVSSHTSSVPITLSVPVAQEFPDGYTGTITGRSHQVGLTTSKFSTIVRDFTNGISLNLSDSGCHGRCTGLLQGAGYTINCSPSTVPFNLTEALGIFPNGSVNTAVTNGSNVFSTNFTYDEFESAGKPLNFSALHKTAKACAGDLQLTQCTLQPALVEYHIVLTNNTISLDPSFTYKDDRMVKLNPAQFQGAQGPTTHGGMALVLNALFSSFAHIRWAGAVGYDLTSSGAAAFEYSTRNDSNPNDLVDCLITWKDPTNDMLATARQLAFRTAITAANTSNATNIQSMNGFQENQVTIYRSNYLYLALALLFTLLSALCVAPIFYGWWRLGRKMTLSPVEIAKAFNAPSLASSDSNLAIQALLKEIGNRELRYGAVSSAQSTGYDGSAIENGAPEQLVIGGPEGLREPREGMVFRG